MIIGCGDFKGVFSTPILQHLSNQSNPMNEFVQYETPMHKKIFHEGVFVGTVNRYGHKWSLYNFPKILDPNKRVLEVLVQDEPDGKVLVRETDTMVSGKKQAFLIDHCFCGECVPKMEHKKHYLYTNALGSDDFICSPSKRIQGNFYSGGFIIADISLHWIKRNRFQYCASLFKLLYSIPLDIIVLPVQPYFYILYQL